MRIIPTIVAMLGLAVVPAALAQGCRGGQTGAQTAAHAGCKMDGTAATGSHEGHAGMQATAGNSPSSAPVKVFMEPVQSVYNNYITVQGALAQDSLTGVSTAATAMAQAIEGDSMKMLPLKVAQQAASLAKAKDIAAARDAFKSLSDSLIQYLAEQKVPTGVYHVAYCPMAKASWLQTSKTVLNPYMGPSMVHCGHLKS